MAPPVNGEDGIRQGRRMKPRRIFRRIFRVDLIHTGKHARLLTHPRGWAVLCKWADPCGWAVLCGWADPCGEISKKNLFATIFVKLKLFCGEKSFFSFIATLHRREQSKKLSEFLLKMFETRRLLTKTYNKPVNSGLNSFFFYIAAAQFPI